MQDGFSLIDDGDWDEDRYDEINYGEIPNALWALIPSSQKYVENIMRFNGYVNREPILRLKCDKEVKVMFKYVTDRIKLVKDKAAMFGIFEPDPKLLDSMPPGFKSTFKRFLAEVILFLFIIVHQQSVLLVVNQCLRTRLNEGKHLLLSPKLMPPMLTKQ